MKVVIFLNINNFWSQPIFFKAVYPGLLKLKFSVDGLIASSGEGADYY